MRLFERLTNLANTRAAAVLAAVLVSAAPAAAQTVIDILHGRTVNSQCLVV